MRSFWDAWSAATEQTCPARAIVVGRTDTAPRTECPKVGGPDLCRVHNANAGRSLGESSPLRKPSSTTILFKRRAEIRAAERLSRRAAQDAEAGHPRLQAARRPARRTAATLSARIRAVVARRTRQARAHRRQLAGPGAAARLGRCRLDCRRPRPGAEERHVQTPVRRLQAITFDFWSTLVDGTITPERTAERIARLHAAIVGSGHAVTPEDLKEAFDFSLE